MSLEIFRTVHGVVLSWDEKAGIAYARADAYRGKELGALRAIYAFHKARTLKEFADACRYIATSHNFFVATKDGDIGFWFCGHYPVRAKGVDPRFPTPGTGEFDWRGFLPFERLPQQINPPQGFFANWNNKPAPWWENGEDTAHFSGHFQRPHRFAQRDADVLPDRRQNAAKNALGAVCFSRLFRMGRRLQFPFRTLLALASSLEPVGDE